MSEKANSFILYSTIGCHLCSDARAMMQTIIANMDSHNTIDEVDIFSTLELEKYYWDKIPAIKSPTGELLYYPFDFKQLSDFMR